MRHLHTLDFPIIHGDLKPVGFGLFMNLAKLQHSLPPKKANVVVHEDGHAALCDFGLSRFQATIPEIGIKAPFPSTAVVPHITTPTGFTTMNSGGTLRFLAPEQMLSEDYPIPTFQSDIYAFSCTCAEVTFHMLFLISLKERGAI